MPHIHEKIDFTVEVFVVHEGKVLLRKHDKYGIWLSVGGHIELDEDPNRAVVREIKEEVGLDVTLIDNRLFKRKDEHYEELISPIGLNRHRISGTHEHVTMIYFAKADTNEITPEKADDAWKWCTKEEIAQLDDVPPDVVYYAKRALDEIL